MVGSGQPGPDVASPPSAPSSARSRCSTGTGTSALLSCLAGAAAAGVAVVVGIPTLRLDGMFAAVTTLAFALAASGYLLVPAEFSWIPQGQVGVPYLFGLSITSQTSIFELCLGRPRAGADRLHGLRHSRTGRVLRSLPSNERAASGYGVRVRAGQADGLRHLRLHRRAGRLPLRRGQPVVPADLVPGPGEPRSCSPRRRSAVWARPWAPFSAPPSSKAAPSTFRRAGSSSRPPSASWSCSSRSRGAWPGSVYDLRDWVVGAGPARRGHADRCRRLPGSPLEPALAP